MTIIRMGLPGILLLLFPYQRYSYEIFTLFQNKLKAFRLIVLAIGGMWISQLTFYLAIQYSNAATATILQYLYPAIIVNFFHPFWQITNNLDITAWLAILFVVFISGMVGFVLFLIGIKRIGDTKESALSTVEPLATVIFSVLILKINFTIADWIGAVCIIMMILLLSI